MPDPSQRVAELVTAYRQANLAFDLIGQSVESEAALGRTDLRVLELLVNVGPMAAGEIAEATGLTSGSVTALVDRLVRARCVRRSQDAGDGRRRIVRVTPHGRERWVRAFATLQAIVGEVAATMDDVELDSVLHFLGAAELACRAALAQGAAPVDASSVPA